MTTYFDLLFSDKVQDVSFTDIQCIQYFMPLYYSKVIHTE